MELRQLFLEKSGGLILAEVVLDRRLKRRLAQSSLVVGSAEVTAEKKLLLETLGQRRPVGAHRFQALEHQPLAAVGLTCTI